MDLTTDSTTQSSSQPRIVGVGVGPGDPQLITVKALRTLEQADVIFVPTTEARQNSIGRAEEIVLANLPDAASKIRRIPFSMAERKGVGEKRSNAWDESAAAAISAFQQGAKTVVFATIGDPNVFSTFSYLMEKVKQSITELVVEFVPGITAMQALAAASKTPLCEGREVLALIPATVGAEKISEVAKVADSITIYKGGRKLEGLKQLLAENGRLTSAILGTDIGCETERITELNSVTDETAPYFSTILSVSERAGIGDKL